MIIVSNTTVRLHITELCIIYLQIIMIQRLISLDLKKTELTWKWMSYCSTCTQPCWRNIFRSPPSRMKVTSRLTTYPRMSMIQRWKRDKSIGDQTALQVHFLFVFHEIPDDDFCQPDCVPSNRSDQLVEDCNENNISKNKHDPTVDFRDMATRALLVFSKICSSLPLSAFLYFFSFLFFFIFLTGGLFAVL